MANQSGVGSFQVVFSTSDKGLRTNVHNKWVALDVYDVQSCYWNNKTYYFTVPNDDENNYEDMQYLVLQYNHEANENIGESPNEGKASLIIHYDDVFLAEGEKCEDIKYIQDWQYNENKIEQANTMIKAGSHVSPYSWPANNPVVVKPSSKVIYRAPVVSLEPGFIVENGAYFETQIGTCVENPCPNLPTFATPQISNCTLPMHLGNELPETPGLFYLWEPEESFGNPWSRVTEFNPPTGKGCLNAKLTTWTICGEKQTYPFTLKYFDEPPTINVLSITHTSWQIYFNLNISNASEYTIELLDANTNQIVYSTTHEVSCDMINYPMNFSVDINQCKVDLCSDLILRIRSKNDCFDEVVYEKAIPSPKTDAPIININNLYVTDFAYQFDVTSITNDYEYYVIEIWDSETHQLVCSTNYNHCNKPISNNSIHFDIKNCLGDCINQCRKYYIKIRAKNYCNETEVIKNLEWIRTNTNFSMPVSYPNVISLNDDGINDELCFTPTGADYYEIVVVDRWGITRYQSSGCVNTSPICVWHPSSDLPTDVYYYTISFSNQCGGKDSQHSFVQVFNGTKKMNSNTDDIINVHPNPTSDVLFITSSKEISRIKLFDSSGVLLIQEESVNTNSVELSLRNFAQGVYSLIVETSDGASYHKIVKN